MVKKDSSCQFDGFKEKKKSQSSLSLFLVKAFRLHKVTSKKTKLRKKDLYPVIPHMKIPRLHTHLLKCGSQPHVLVSYSNDFHIDEVLDEVIITLICSLFEQCSHKNHQNKVVSQAQCTMSLEDYIFIIQCSKRRSLITLIKLG